MSKDNLIILDGDEIAFNCSAVLESRSIIATHTPSGREKEFKTRTEFRNFIKDKYDEHLFAVRDLQKPAEFYLVKRLLKTHIEKLLKKLNADSSEIYISGDQNFRLTLPLPEPYKGQRIFSLRPVHLDAAKQTLIGNGAVVVHDREADDMLAQRMYDGYMSGNRIIAVTVDKDARMTPGLLVNPDKLDEGVLKIEGFGSLSVNETVRPKKVSGTGRLWFYFQLLAGDITDNYNPRNWLPKEKRPRFGDMSCYDLLKDCKDDKEALTVIVNKYKEWYPQPFAFTDCTGKYWNSFTWVDCLQVIADCAYMRRSDNDRWDAREVLNAIFGDNYEQSLGD